MATTLTIDELAGVSELALQPTGWIEVGQSRIDTFADATDDHQWIHTDPQRAADGPFGGTVAHGLLTLSLVARLLQDMLEVSDASMAINYGFNKVRFPAPVPSGSRVRATGSVVNVSEVDGGVQVVVGIAIECEGGTRPGCVAEAVARFLR